jgi:hypothetical protein
MITCFPVASLIVASPPFAVLCTGPDDATSFNYIRPLATIEPTAIRLGMPVNTDFGADQIGPLQTELLQPKYANALIFIAWEHVWEDRLAKRLVAWGGGNPNIVPDWPGNYDTIFVIELSPTAAGVSVGFSEQREGLTVCRQRARTSA